MEEDKKGNSPLQRSRYLIYGVIDENEARPLCRQLLEVAEMAYLTTVDERGFPQARAMENFRNKNRYPTLVDFFKTHENDFMILFGTHASSNKVGQIRKNPNASAYYCKPKEYRGLMLGGPIGIVVDCDLKKRVWKKGWETYYPAGMDDPEYTVLSLRPQVARYYQGRQVCDFTLKGKQ
jgi:general stress protein 26